MIDTDPSSAVRIGVDGCPGGWVAVALPAADVTVVPELDELIAAVRHDEVAAMAIDMPIALLDHHPRRADVEARRHLGPRRSSVFPTPVRTVIDAVDYDEARRRSRSQCGVAPTIQAWHLVPRIRQLDRLVTADLQDRVVEAHPELAFRRLADRPLDEPKTTATGREQRRALLEGRLGADVVDRVLRTRAAPVADLLDALVLTVTATRLLAGDAIRLGDERDRFGRRAEIVY